MLHSNTMRLGTDVFSFNPQCLLTSKVPIDTTGQASINGFNIEGSQPAGSIRNAVFKIDDEYFYFPTVTDDGNSSPVIFPYEINVDNVLNYGTPVNNLARIVSIPSWIDKKIFPIIALQAPNTDLASRPSVKIAIKATASSDLLSRTEETAEFVLSTTAGITPSIIDVTTKTSTTGSASIAIKAFIRVNDEWSNEYDLQSLKNLNADAIKFKITYSVSSLNSESAKVDQIQIRYSVGSSSSVANAEAEIVTITQDYENELRYCQATIRHKKLIDSNIDAYVSFRSSPKYREVIEIGTGTGENQTYNLKPIDQEDNDPKIDQTSIRLFVDGVEKTGFNYNVETSQVTLTVPNGSVLTASYQYNIEAETWRQMSLSLTEPYKATGWYSSRFEYALPDEEEGKTIATVKFVLSRPAGSVVNEDKGLATGLTQVFVLPHKAKLETIKIPNAEFSYDEDSQMLKVVAPRGTNLVLSYDWIGESQEIDAFVTGLSVLELTA